MNVENIFDQFQEIFYTLEKNKLRTVLTGLTVSWGIFMLILLLGAGNGMENGVRRAFQEDAVNSIWINPGQTSLPHKGFKQGRHIVFHNSDVDELGKSIQARELISGRLYLDRNTTVRYGSVAGRFQVVGVHSDYAAIENSQLVKGRLLHLFDDKSSQKVAVPGIKVQKELFGNNDPVGEYIYINGIPFKVVGIFNDPGDEWQKDRIYIPISTFQRVFSRNDRIHNLVMTVKSGEISETDQLEDEVRGILARRHHFSVDDQRAVFLHNTLAEYRKYMSLFANIRVFIWIIGMGSIVAGVVGISNIMLITVKERTREIGIRKAVGAPPASIVRMILVESLLITFGFGYVGIIAGVALLEVMGKVITGAAYFHNPEIDLSIAFGALFILILSGVTAGLFPALRASRIRPVDALSDE